MDALTLAAVTLALATLLAVVVIVSRTVRAVLTDRLEARAGWAESDRRALAAYVARLEAFEERVRNVEASSAGRLVRR